VVALPNITGESSGEAAMSDLRGTSARSAGAAAHDEDLSSASSTTESRVATFTRELLNMRRSSEEKQKAGFERVKKEMLGSWPREISDLPDSVLKSVREAIEGLFEPTEVETQPDGASVKEEVTLIALQCRYNCFHRGFFRACALLNHSCDANAAMKYTPGRSLTAHADLGDAAFTSLGVVSLVTCRKMKKGELIAVKYLGDFDFILGVLPRRDLLNASWLFVCNCGRCVADLQPGAQTEWVRCTATESCSGSVHLPVPAKTGTVVAKLADEFVRTCPECGKECRMIDGLIDAAHEVRLGTLQLSVEFHLPNSSLRDIHARAVELRRIVRRWCHDAHWLHTLVLYQTAILAQRRIDEAFNFATEENGRITPTIAAAQFGLDNFVPWRAEEPAYRPLREEVDLLGWQTELERRLAPFYPEEQLWALHVAIGRLAVLLALAFPQKLPEAESLIVKKAVHFPRSVAARAVAALSRHPDLSAKQLRVVLKALK
jgi:hypothetical protein